MFYGRLLYIFPIVMYVLLNPDGKIVQILTSGFHRVFTILMGMLIKISTFLLTTK